MVEELSFVLTVFALYHVIGFVISFICCVPCGIGESLTVHSRLLFISGCVYALTSIKEPNETGQNEPDM
jgi:hypothetical protein